jgi:F plasmid transfer operon protein TraF
MHRALACLVLVFVVSRDARAQDVAVIGIRAQGMGGAFTAVSDDATATWWNPAGLAGGAFFNLTFEIGGQRQPHDDSAVPAWHTASGGFAVAYPALGLSYYRVRISEIRPEGSTDGDAAGRQDPGATRVRLRSVILNQFGVTVGQSLGAHVVLASTVKVVHAGAAADIRQRATTTVDDAEELDVPSDTHAGLDIGAMTKFGPLTLGVAVRNATEPTFGEGVDSLKLTRSARAGIAIGSAGFHGAGRLTIDADVDVIRTITAFGDVRNFGIGAEVWTAGRRVGVRGGVSGYFPGQVRLGPSGGVSVAVKSAVYIDAYVTGGADEGRRGLGSALRVTF